MNRFNDNKAFIKNLKSGNEKAYAFLVDKYHPLLCAYAESLISDRDVAQDIVQNVFIKIWEKRKFLKEDFKIKNFLYKSVFHEFIDEYRKNRAVTKLEGKYIEAVQEYLEQDNEEEKLIKLFEIVQKEINNLPPKCKRIFLLSKREGLSNHEISEHLNISIKTVEAHITKGFTLIRERVNILARHEIILLLLHGSNYIKKLS